MRSSVHQFAVLAFSFDWLRECGLVSGTHMHHFHPSPRSSWERRACALTAISVLLLFASPAWALLPHRESHDLHKQIEALEMQWRDAVLHNDVRQMDRLLADDYLGISANGTVETKSEELAQSRAGTLRIQSLNLNDIKVRIYGNTAVVTSRAELTGVNGQSDISGNYRYTRVYNKRYGKWRIISFEASRIHDADARADR